MPTGVALQFIACGLILACLTGCVSSKQALLSQQTNAAGTPVWVLQGSSAVKLQQRRLFHGVGRASLGGSLSHPTIAADQLAQQELGKLISSYVEIVSRHFLASGHAEGAEFNRHMAKETLTQLSRLQLTRGSIVGHWKDKRQNLVYAVAQFDLHGLKQALGKISGINQQFYRYFRQNANAIFDSMARPAER